MMIKVPSSPLRSSGRPTGCCSRRLSFFLFAVGVLFLLIVPALVYFSIVERHDHRMQIGSPKLVVDKRRVVVFQNTSTSGPRPFSSDFRSVEGGHCPEECLWDKDTELNKQQFTLIGFLSVRIYPDDRQKFTSMELVQWLQYMRFAGVEKMLVYDSFCEPEERQYNILKAFVDQGYVEYYDWSVHNPYHYTLTQVNAYKEGYSKYSSKTKYVVHFDIDEVKLISFPLIWFFRAIFEIPLII